MRVAKQNIWRARRQGGRGGTQEVGGAGDGGQLHQQMRADRRAGVITELRKTFFVDTPLGAAEAFFLDGANTVERTCLVGVFQCQTKEFWWWPNHLVRL